MAKKQKTGDETSQIVKKIKSVMLDAMIREWLNSPVKEWDGKTPLQRIKSGEGKQVLEAISAANTELKNERDGIKIEIKDEEDETDDRTIEGNIGEQRQTIIDHLI